MKGGHDIAGGMTRRTLLERFGLGVAATSLGMGLEGRLPGSAAAASGAVALPSPAQVRADYQRMVDFGPRLTGNESHLRYIQWLREEMVKAGAELLPCDDYEYERWSVGRFGLDVIDGSAPGSVKVASYYTRSQETPAEGLTAPLVYAGVVPAPSASGTDLGALQAGIARYPDDLTSWAHATSGRLGGAADGAILVVDLPMPAPATAGVFLPIAQYLHWPGHTEADWIQIDYKRTWILPGLGVPLAPFAQMGAAGVVFIVDSSWEALADNYLPFDHGYEPVPALYVDRDTGRALRAQTESRPNARLTLTATRTKVKVPSVTAVLRGETDESVILNTHTDGQGFVEENGGVAFVHLARHFGSLPAGQRLKRTLVFAAWPGHMSGALPELAGWMAAHQDLVKKAAAAMTIEHLGCSEWLDTADKGYHATGQNETFGVWVSLGKLFEATRDALTATGDAMARTALLRPPVQFGVGGAFQSAGIPQIGAIAGPEYLLTIKPNGDMDKLDEKLAAAQTAWLADILRRIEPISPAELRAGDPTLGNTTPTDDTSTKSDCTPTDATLRAQLADGRGLAVRFYGRRRRRGGVLLRVSATGSAVSAVTVELRRGGRLFARSSPLKAAAAASDVVLRRRRGHRFPIGAYTLIVRHRGKIVARRAVRLGTAIPKPPS
jgi:hypothetical protein